VAPKRFAAASTSFTPSDIAAGIAYLASDDAKFVTGSELVIEGGYTAR
jgi:NAD(P)-dependent dehydrogenase (short-subunit alcohol dehydrogenase family)